MISSLQELVAPLTAAEFIGLLHARAITYRPSLNRNRFLELVDSHGLHELIVSGTFPPKELRVHVKTEPVLPAFYLRQGKVDPAALALLIKKGVSLIMNPLDPYVSSLATICRQMKSELREKVFAGAIVTTGSGGAFKLHYDAQDVIVLQVEGAKRWKIYPAPVVNPVGGMPEQAPPHDKPIFDETLLPGDLLLVPGGYWHHCENVPELSLHVVFQLVPPTGWHAVKALTSKLLTEETFRVPFTRLANAEEVAAHEMELKQRLIETIGRLSFSDFLSRDADEAPSVIGADDGA